jgi:hypothetical protein
MFAENWIRRSIARIAVRVHFSHTHTLVSLMSDADKFTSEDDEMSDKLRSRAGVTARLFGERAMRRGSKVSSISLRALDLERPIREARVLRGLGDSTQGVRQLACEVQSRATAAGSQAALSARWPKSCP